MNGINHRWLKPPTILVNRQALFKLCDVGMTKQNRSSKTCHYSKIDYYDFVNKTILFFFDFQRIKMI